MFLKIEKKIVIRYSEAIKYFSEDYKNALISKESLVARFIISKEVKNIFDIESYIPLINENKIPLYNNGIFWSISHKEGVVFIGIDNKMLGVDIEIYKERDNSLLNKFFLDEYSLLGGVSWYNFYILWTAKESCIKYNLLNLEELNNISLFDVKDIKIKISNINFSKKILLKYKNNINQVFFGVKDGLFYSICSENMIE